MTDRGPPPSCPFSEAQSASELALLLKVPVNAIFCVELMKDKTCGASDENCDYPPAHRNSTGNQHGRFDACVLHKQKWFPRNNQRGYALLGKVYMRPCLEAKNGRAVCCCENKICKSIGYSPFLVRVPGSHVDDIVEALGLGEAKKATVKARPRSYRVAPWHFAPENRYFNESTQAWRLKEFYKPTEFVDANKQRWIGFPPCDYSLQKFIDEEVLPLRTKLPANAAAGMSDLPAWVAEMAKVEQLRKKAPQPTLKETPNLPMRSADPVKIGLAGRKRNAELSIEADLWADLVLFKDRALNMETLNQAQAVHILHHLRNERLTR